MNEYNNDYQNGGQDGYYQESRVTEQGVAVYLSKVMGWMCLGLFTTLVSAMMCLTVPAIGRIVYSSSAAWITIIIAQFGLVIVLSAAINKISASAAIVLFMLYSAVTGVTMSVVALAFETASIAFAFGLTAFIFLGMAFYGYATKKDLTKIGSLALFGLIGIIGAGIINMFFRNGMLDFIILCVGVVVFIALIAYDTQRIKGYYISAIESGQDEESDQVRKMAIYGALSLYLDFINLFLKLLRLFGKRR